MDYQTIKAAYERWHPIAHRCELDEPGSFVRARWLGSEDVVAWRDQDGTLITFDGVCPHRGARIFESLHGRRPLVCQYHGLSVRCGEIKTPFPLDQPVRLNTIRHEWVGDWLFASINPSASVAEQLGDAANLVKAAGAAIATREDFHTRTWRCDWRLAVENALEDVHISLVHPATLGKLGMEIAHEERDGENSVAVYRVNEHVKAGLAAVSRYFQEGSSHYATVFMYPFSQLSWTGGYTFSLQSWFPSGHGALFYQRTYGAHLAAGVEHQFVRPMFISAADMNRRIFDEDRTICERLADFGRRGPLGEREQKIGWFREALDAHAKK